MPAFEFNLDTLKEAGSALKDLFSKEDSQEKKQLEEFEKAKEEYKPTEEQKAIGEIEDIGTKSVDEILKTEKEEKKASEAELEKKLSNIEKVLDKFSGDVTVSKATPLPEDTASVLNLKPVDMGSLIAKEYLSNVTSKMTGQTSSDQDRIALLYDNLRKLNVIK
jgi:hypothetical protein